MEKLAIVLALLESLDVKLQLVALVIWILAMPEVHKVSALVFRMTPLSARQVFRMTPLWKNLGRCTTASCGVTGG